MTSSSDPSPSAEATEQLSLATAQLRDRPHPRSVEIADAVLERALRSSRRSLPVRVAAPHDFVRISDQVIITMLRRRVDDALVAGAVGRILLQVDRDERLRELTVELFAQFGVVLLDLADQARGVVDEVLQDLLGGPSVTVEVVTSHVHISDVTVGDPHDVEPQDERHP